MVLKNRVKVVIFIPLPVEPGDDPIRPTSRIKNSVAGIKSVKLAKINPQLLNEIAWKTVLAIDWPRVRFLSVLLYSRKKNRMDVMARSVLVPYKIIVLWRENR